MKMITLLIISAYFDGADQTFAVLPMPDRAACEAAVPAIADNLIRSFPDVAVACVDTGIISASPYPKARPANLKVGK